MENTSSRLSYANSNESSMTTTVSELNMTESKTSEPGPIYTDGPYFDAVELDIFMKIHIWPLMIMCIYAMCGSVGNTIVLYIYWFKWKKNKTRVFILCLGMLDLTNCLFNIPFEIAVLWFPLSFDQHYLCKISRGCTYVINNTCSLVFVAVAIERYLLVYYPLRSRQLTPRFAKIMCLIAFIGSCCVSWPSFVFYGKQTFIIPIPNSHVAVRGTTCLISDDNMIHKTGLILVFTSFLFGLLILTFIILTFLYIAIGRQIYMATCTDITERQDKDSTSKFLGKSIISAITGVTLTPSEKNMRKGRLKSVSINDAISRYDQDSSSSELSPLDMESSMTSSPSCASHISHYKKLSSSNVKHQMSRRFSTMKARPTRKNTVMMRMVTIAFMLSFTPFLIILVIRYTYPNEEYYTTLDINGKIVYSVFLRTYFINSMVNPFIYGFMNIHFRKMVKDMFSKIFCKCCCRT